MKKDKENQEETTKGKKKISKIKIIVLLFLLLIIAEFIRSNTYIDVDEYDYTSEDVPQAFDGVRIVQISDYHNHGGSYDDRLIAKIKEQEPDYIFLTGDIADSILTDIDDANAFLEKVSTVADCYLVWGNHDYDITDEERQSMKDCCEENGITVLENDYAVVERNGEQMLIVGTDEIYDKFDSLIERLPDDIDLTVWLHHYPEDFEYISDTADCNLFFAGHAHGGLIGLPFTRFGIYAPGQGIFPKYTGGDYYCNDSEMLLSRGVGNSGITKRFFDPFNLIVCELHSA